MVKFVINCMLNIQNFKINFFSMLNSTQYRSYSPDFGASGGAEEGAQWGKCPTSPWY
jgi:hypothetical protein